MSVDPKQYYFLNNALSAFSANSPIAAAQISAAISQSPLLAEQLNHAFQNGALTSFTAGIGYVGAAQFNPNKSDTVAPNALDIGIGPNLSIDVGTSSTLATSANIIWILGHEVQHAFNAKSAMSISAVNSTYAYVESLGYDLVSSGASDLTSIISSDISNHSIDEAMAQENAFDVSSNAYLSANSSGTTSGLYNYLKSNNVIQAGSFWDGSGNILPGINIGAGLQISVGSTSTTAAEANLYYFNRSTALGTNTLLGLNVGSSINPYTVGYVADAVGNDLSIAIIGSFADRANSNKVIDINFSNFSASIQDIGASLMHYLPSRLSGDGDYTNNSFNYNVTDTSTGNVLNFAYNTTGASGSASLQVSIINPAGLVLNKYQYQQNGSYSINGVNGSVKGTG